MKISAINGANSLTFAKRNNQKNYYHHHIVTYDENKVRIALACMATLAVAGITVALVKDAGNNSVKSAYNSAKQAAKNIIPDPMIMAVGKKRDAAALSKYKAYTAKTKLNRLQERITNGEFKDLPLHAKKNIEKQKIELIKNVHKVH